MTQHQHQHQQLTIIVGTYERLLYGLTVSVNEAGATFTPIFIFPAHISAIKCVAATKQYLATGSTDEHIKLYNLHKRREIGTLNPHQGVITRLQFHKNSHLISASEDGTIVLYRCKDWEVLKILKGHTSAVEWIDIHPTGKVALSAGRDGTIKVWDLIHGRLAKSLRITSTNAKVGTSNNSDSTVQRRGSIPERVTWSPSGFHYAVMSEKTIVIYDISTGREEAVIMGIGKISCMLYTLDSTGTEVVLTGGEDKMIRVFKNDASCIASWNSGHGTRVKDMDTLEYNGRRLIASCSSDGGVRLWDYDVVLDCIAGLENGHGSKTESVIEPLGSYNADTRVTCISMTTVTDKNRSGSVVNEDEEVNV